MHRLVFTVLMQHLPENQSAPALQLLSEALQHAQGQIRELAVVAIAELPLSPAQRVTALVPAMRDSSPRVRRRAARAVGDQGAAAQGALPQLLAGLRDADMSVRRDCAGALGRLGPVAHAAAPLLMPLLADAETRTRMVAAVAFKRIGKATVPTLLGGLASPDLDVRARCVTLLKQIAPDDERVALAVRAVGDEAGGPLADQAMFAVRTPPPAPMPIRVPVNSDTVVDQPGLPPNRIAAAT